MCALSLKKTKSYIRFKDAIRKSHVLLMEAETNKWLGMWKVTGKLQYLNAGLRWIENLYTKLNPIMLQGMRENRLPVLNHGRGAQSFDVLCELHNLWLKQLPMTVHLDSVIAKSRHLSLVRRCAVELWGKKNGWCRIQHPALMTR